MQDRTFESLTVVWVLLEAEATTVEAPSRHFYLREPVSYQIFQAFSQEFQAFSQEFQVFSQEFQVSYRKCLLF